MLQKDSNAKVEPLPYGIGFMVLNGTDEIAGFDGLSFGAIQETQSKAPVKIGACGRKTWWIFRDQIYWEDEHLTAHEVLYRIKSRLGINSDKRISTSRERIPEKVRNEVWRRDEGKCVRCGSREKLEFDHIIPISKGGSNTARNIELLCESCNRKKSNRI